MGFFQGVARAYGEISERKEREGVRKEEIELRKSERAEDKADRYAYAEYASNLGVKATLLTEQLKGSRGSGGAKVEEVSNAISSMRTLGLDKELVTRIENTGNVPGIINANKQLIEGYAQMKANGMTDAAIRDQLNTEVSNWDFNEQSTNTIDFDGKDYEVSNPGDVGVVPIVVRPNLEVSELTKVEERILSTGVNKLATDQRRINTALTTLGESYNNGDWDANPDYYEATLNFLTQKQMELDSALNAYKDGDFSGVLQLTGRGPVESVLKKFGGRDQINEVFLDESIPEVVEPWRYQGEGSEVINQTLKNLGVF